MAHGDHYRRAASNNDYVRYAPTNVAPVGLPPDGVDTTVLPDGRRYDWTGAAWVLQPVTTCPAPMTRAALLALRAANGLSIQCHYVITDYVEGRFLAGTTIQLHAVATNELSENVSLNTLYDNEAWAARYDIDRNTMVEVSDNNGNVVRSNVTGRVAAWDWGNAAVTNNTSDGGIVTFTYGAPFPFQNNRIGARANVTLTARTGGSIVDATINGTLAAANSNATVTSSTIDEGGTVTATGYTGGGNTCFRTTVSGTLNVSGSTTAQQVLYSTIARNAIVALNLCVAANSTTTMSACTVENDASVSHTAAEAPLTMTTVTVSGTGSSVTHLRGQLTMTAVSLRELGRIVMNGPNPVGAANLSYTAIGQNGTVQHYGAGTLTVGSSTISDGASVVTATGSNSTTNIQQTRLTGASFAVTATSTAGNITVQNSHVSASAFIQKSGTGALNVTSTHLDASARITLSGVRSLNVIGFSASNLGRIEATATAGAGVADNVSYSSAASYGAIVFSASGAAGNGVLYSSVRGLTGTIVMAGTQTGATVTRFTVDNGVVRFDSNAAFPTMLDVGVRDGGLLTVQFCTAPKDIRYSTVQSRGRWLFNACTANGQMFGLDVAANGGLTHSAACGSAFYCGVSVGTLLHNGGTITNSVKRFGGQLTTGLFNHTNIGHYASTVKSLTAPNTNRVDWTGLPTQLV